MASVNTSASASRKRKGTTDSSVSTPSVDASGAGSVGANPVSIVATTSTAAKPTRCKHQDLNVGEKLSRLEYYTVIGKTADRIEVKNERGFTFTISSSIVNEEMFSATQYDEEVKVTLTELIELFMSVGNVIFQVAFDKKLKEQDVALELKKISDGQVAIGTDQQRRSEAKKIMQGEERTLIGYLIKSQPTFARSDVIDLELPDSNAYRIRQVDHRTLKWMIYKRVKYVLKK